MLFLPACDCAGCRDQLLAVPKQLALRPLPFSHQCIFSAKSFLVPANGPACFAWTGLISGVMSCPCNTYPISVRSVSRAPRPQGKTPNSAPAVAVRSKLELGQHFQLLIHNLVRRYNPCDKYLLKSLHLHLQTPCSHDQLAIQVRSQPCSHFGPWTTMIPCFK
jgi:hypothetical protein